MSFFRGHLPHPIYSMSCGLVRSRILPLVGTLVVGGLAAPAAVAQESLKLTLTEAEDLALSQEPGQLAYLARAAAARAGELPDRVRRLCDRRHDSGAAGHSTGLSAGANPLHTHKTISIPRYRDVAKCGWPWTRRALGSTERMARILLLDACRFDRCRISSLF